MKNKEIDTETIHRVLRGDAAAFRFLVERYQNMVFTIAYKVIRNREDAEDAAQEVFVKCFRSLGSYDYRSQFSTWLYRVAYNHAIDTYKKKRNKMPVSEVTDRVNARGVTSTHTEEKIDNKMLRSLLKKAIDSLPAEERIIVILYYYDEQPLRVIADIIGIKENYVKIKLYRIRSKLSGLLQSKMGIILPLIS